MLGQYYTNDHIRKYTVLFGSLFNEIYLRRDDNNKQQVQKLKVPIGYGPTEKTLARVKEQPDLEEPLSIQLPRMSFELVDLQYDPSRKLNSLNKICGPNNSFVYSPISYNLVYNLYIMVKTTTDGLRIVEQILPFFTPHFNISATVMNSNGFDLKHDLPIVLNSVQQQDNYEGSLEERRTLIWTLTFTLKGYLYGPSQDSKLIKYVEARIFDGLSAAERMESIIVTGGQTANNVATTTRPPSVPWQDVNPEGNWDFITEIDLA